MAAPLSQSGGNLIPRESSLSASSVSSLHRTHQLTTYTQPGQITRPKQLPSQTQATVNSLDSGSGQKDADDDEDTQDDADGDEKVFVDANLFLHALPHTSYA
jgi:hypothetical protein